MTNKQIEAARELIVARIPVAAWSHESLDALDAPCEAARQPESLVGRRIAVRAFATTLVGHITHDQRVLRITHSGSQAGPCAPGELTVFEDEDFELLEDTDAK